VGVIRRTPAISLCPLLLVSCGAPPSPCPKPAPSVTIADSIRLKNEPVVVEPGEELVAADQAYNLGDPVRAVRILELIEPTDARHADGELLRKKARADVEALATGWHEEMRALLAKGQFQLARARGLYILEHFPVSVEMRGTVEAGLKEVEKGVADARVEISDLDRQAADQLLRHDFVGALRTLRRAEKIAKRFDVRDALDIERQMAAAEFRFAQEKVPEPVSQVAARKTTKNTRKRRAAEKGSKSLSPPPVESERDVSNAKEVSERLREATRYQQNNSYFEAIVRFEQVRDLDPTNETAIVALQGLEDRRKALVKDYLAKANEFFLQQDLAGAVPYFKKVRKLDPKNEEALEGLEMFENLERIRNQRQ